MGRSCDRWAVAAGERRARAAGTRRNGTGDRCARAVAAGLTGSRAEGRIAVVGPGWSGTGAWTSYALDKALLKQACKDTGVDAAESKGKIMVAVGHEMDFLEVLDRRWYQVCLVTNKTEKYRAASRTRIND